MDSWHKQKTLPTLRWAGLKQVSISLSCSLLPRHRTLADNTPSSETGSVRNGIIHLGSHSSHSNGDAVARQPTRQTEQVEATRRVHQGEIDGVNPTWGQDMNRTASHRSGLVFWSNSI